MNTTKIPWMRMVGIVVGSVASSLLALTALHANLDLPLIRRFDREAQMFVHGWTSPAVTRMMLALTWLGAIKIFAVALASFILLLWMQRRIREGALLAFSLIGAFLLNEGLKLHFHRARPAVAWAIGDEHTFSFPSGHSLFAVVLYGTLCWLSSRKAGRTVPVVVLLALGVGLSRIYLGMHWPTDVLAGWFAGIMWLLAVVALDSLWCRSHAA